MPSVSSLPSAHTRSPSIRNRVDSARRVTASAACGEISVSAASLVIARYISPLSMNGSPSFSATRLPTADLPDATPPSIVMIMDRSLFLEAGGATDRRHLTSGQHAPAAVLQPAQAKGTERGPLQGQDLAPDRLQHAADLPPPTFADHHAQLGAAGVASAPRRSQKLDLRGFRQAIVELHAAPEGIQVFCGGHAGGHDEVFLGDFEARMRQAVRHLAVVGEQDQARAVGVEAPDRKQSMAKQALLPDHV